MRSAKFLHDPVTERMRYLSQRESALSVVEKGKEVHLRHGKHHAHFCSVPSTRTICAAHFSKQGFSEVAVVSVLFSGSESFPLFFT